MLKAVTHSHKELVVHTDNQEIALMANKQEAIGWHLVKYGFLLHRWQHIQSACESFINPNHNRYNGAKWSQQVQRLLLNYVSGCWEY